MEREKSTKLSSASSNIKESSSLDFELPVDPEFRSVPTRVSIDVALEINRQMRKDFPKSIPTLEERRELKSLEEFVL